MRKPKWQDHICESETNCLVCKNYINKLDDYRQMRGDTKKKIKFRLDGTSNLNKVGEGQRKFDLPKPRLSRPIKSVGVISTDLNN